MAGMDIAPVMRTQDIGIIKHNEDMKHNVDQSNIGQQFQQKENRQSQEVVNTNKGDWYSKQPDAREKGSNQYYGDGGQNKKKKETPDKVVAKKQNSGFDFRI